MTFSLLLIGIVLSILGALATLILCIVALATGKQRNGLIYGVVFMMSVIFAVLSIIEVTKRGANKVKQVSEWFKEKTENNIYGHDYSSDNQYYAFIPEGNNDSISPAFYDKRDYENYCIPLVYPYRFNSENNMVMTYTSLEKINAGKKDSCLNQLRYISSFTFDDKLLLAKRDNNEMMRMDGNKKSDLPDFTYFIFDFATGKCEAFMNENRMNEEAEKRGFIGQKYMDSAYTHYWNYSGAEEGD